MPRKMSPPSFQQDQHYHHHHLQLAAVKHESPATTTITTHTSNNTNNNVYPKMSPSSLKIHRDSRMIKKSSSITICSSSASISSLVTSPGGGGGGSTNKPHNHHHHQQQQQQRGPVIIYTHSPKIIHTNPRDFMSLVQKLTGMSRNEGVEGPTARDAESSVAIRGLAAPGGDQPDQKMVKVEGSLSITAGNNSSNCTDDNENESSSVITDENCSTSTTGDVVAQLNPYVGPPFFDPPPPLPLSQTTCLPNFPPFMDRSSDMLCCSGDPVIGEYSYMDFNFPYNQIT